MEGPDQSQRRYGRLRAMPSQRLRPVRLVTGLRAATQSIAWIASRAGLFQKHGLSATFPRLEVGGPECVAGLLRGDWDFAQTGIVPVAQAVLEGEKLVVLMRTSALHGYVVIATNLQTRRLNELNGKTVGVIGSAYAGQTGVIARLAIERAGATASFVGLGTYSAIIAALADGQIDAGSLPIDYEFITQNRHRWNFFKTPALGLPEVIATTSRAIQADRLWVLCVLRALIETIHLLKTKPHLAIHHLKEFLQFSDPQAAHRIHENYATSLPLVPRPDLSEGTETLRNIFFPRFPEANSLGQRSLADLSLIDELERDGFIEQLWRK